MTTIDQTRLGLMHRYWNAANYLTEGTFRSHQVPVTDVKANPEHLRIFEDWMRSYQPEDLFDENGRLRPELAALAPKGTGAWEPIHIPMAASYSLTSISPR